MALALKNLVTTRALVSQGFENLPSHNNFRDGILIPMAIIQSCLDMVRTVLEYYFLLKHFYGEVAEAYNRTR